MNPERELDDLAEIVKAARSHPTKEFISSELIAAMVIARAIHTLARVIETRPGAT